MHDDDSALHDFKPMSGARMQCGACAAVLAACDVELVEVVPLDPTIDPQNEAHFVVARCPLCNGTGGFVLHHGSTASHDEQALLAAIGQYARPVIATPK